MDVRTFATLLSKELIKRGIPKELAVKHAVSLVRTFDEEDLKEISSYTSSEEFCDLSDSLAELIKDKDPSTRGPSAAPARPVSAPALPEDCAKTGEFTPVKTSTARPIADGATRTVPISDPAMDLTTREVPIPGAAAEPIPDGATREIPAVGAQPKSSGVEHMKTKAFRLESGEDLSGTRSFDGIKTSDISIPSDTQDRITVVNIPVPPAADEDPVQEIYLDEEEDLPEEEKVVLTPRGKAFFWGITIATSPVTLVVSILVLGVFALGILTVCAFIVASLLIVCAVAVAGSGLTLIGVIYGAIEIVSKSPGIGLYEIGLGICCGGLALCLGILIYNFAVLVLPYVLKQLLVFEGYCLKRVSPMIRRFREECNRL